MKKLFKTIRAAALGLLVLGTASCCLKDIPVTGLSLSQTSLTLIEGEEAHLTVTVTPADATDPSVVWRSSDASVATVNDGLVKAVAPGTATITVSTPDGLQTASCIVTVNRQAVPVASVSLDKTSLEMTVGDEATLTATVAPADADVKTVSWSSSDEGVATVADGKVTAVGAGSATITVTTTDGGKTATCEVTVEAAPEPTGDLYKEVSSFEDGREYILGVTKDDGSVYVLSYESGDYASSDTLAVTAAAEE